MNSKYILLLLTFFLSTLLFVTGCENEPTEVEDYKPEAVLHAYLISNQPYGDVWLEWVATNISEVYDPREHGVRNVDTLVIFPYFDEFGNRVDTTLTDEDVYYYEDPDYPGHYIHNSDPSIIAKPNWRYRIEAKSAEVNIWAETTVPEVTTLGCTHPAVHAIIDVEPDTTLLDPWENFPTFTRDDEYFSVFWSDSSDYLDPRSGGNVLTITALTDTSELEKLDPDWDPDDPDDALEPEDMNRQVWTIAPNYQASMAVPWIYFDWVGPHKLTMSLGSYEYYRYFFTMIQVDSDPNLIPESYVNGAMGCFGAMDTHFLYINMKKVGTP